MPQVFKGVDNTCELDREQLKELLRLIDSSLRALPATAQVHTAGSTLPGGRVQTAAAPPRASTLRLPFLLSLHPQVAKQEGEFLAELFRTNDIRPGQRLDDNAKPFDYAHKGSMAYVGSGETPPRACPAGQLQRRVQDRQLASARLPEPPCSPLPCSQTWL
jgi:hypothetical protein